MPSRGEIVLANFNPTRGTEAGKIRPCLIVQTNILNITGHPSTIVIPTTTQLIDDAYPLRLRILAREKLQQNSDLMLDQIRAIDNKRLQDGILARLTQQEQRQVNQFLKVILAIE